MIYVSIDCETTGLDRNEDQLLSIGLAIEDTNSILPISDIPQLHIIILQRRISGSPFAINMNRDLISNMVNYQNAKNAEEREIIRTETDTVYLEEDKAAETVWKFLWDNGIRFDGWETYTGPHAKDEHDVYYPALTSSMKKTYFNVAGKNFGTFDKIFLERLPRWKQLFGIRSRIIDPAILFTDWENDDQLPGLQKCLDRAGINGTVTHNALQDAIDIIKVMRKI